MHKFNRFYLLFAVCFSFFIPLIPAGYAFTSEINSLEILDFTIGDNVTLNITEASQSEFHFINWSSALLLGYLIACVFLSFRFWRNIRQFDKKGRDASIRSFKSATLCLLQEKTLPHTFLGKIYINEDDYKNHRIDPQILEHEFAHAKQGHSYDIILIELLTIVFWIIPILKIYKKAIQLNHEFLADEAVNNQFKKVKNYQHLLLGFQPQREQIYLASNINFYLTKKRLKMMTKKSSKTKKIAYMSGVIPLFIALLMLFGQCTTAQVSSGNGSDAERRDAFFKNAQVRYKTDDGKVMLKHYHELSQEMKDKLPPPPPAPPAPDGRVVNAEVTPLAKGTIVELGENSMIYIGGKNGTKAGLPPPPPPPAPPAPPKGGGLTMTMPEDGYMRPPPPPPITINKDEDFKGLSDEGAEFLFDGKVVSWQVAAKAFKDQQIEQISIQKNDTENQVILKRKKQ
ncbi:hypothetical protein N9B82_01230 [Saprospiraceae bacterium]|nr:hypothetical protein [Saprospiraceae bacterium]